MSVRPTEVTLVASGDLRETANRLGWPAQEALERHVDAGRFLDFVSTRSPVFKERPLPRSKKEAIELMMEHPNLIRRPILIKGSKVIFGFDKEAYNKLA